MSAAEPLPPRDRGAFLKAVAAELADCREIGPGSVHRAIVVAQKRFFDPPNLSTTAGVARRRAR